MGQNMLRENMNDLFEQYCHLVEKVLFWSTETKRGTAYGLQNINMVHNILFSKTSHDFETLHQPKQFNNQSETIKFC